MKVLTEEQAQLGEAFLKIFGPIQELFMKLNGENDSSISRYPLTTRIEKLINLM